MIIDLAQTKNTHTKKNGIKSLLCLMGIKEKREKFIYEKILSNEMIEEHFTIDLKVLKINTHKTKERETFKGDSFLNLQN